MNSSNLSFLGYQPMIGSHGLVEINWRIVILNGKFDLVSILNVSTDYVCWLKLKTISFTFAADGG